MGGRRQSYRIECHTLLSTAYAHNTRAAAIVSHIRFPNYSERSPLSDALARVSHYRIECYTLSYRMLYRMSHTNLHGIRAQHAWRRNRVTYPIPKRSSLSDLCRYPLSDALVRASTCALVARWLEQHSSRMLSDALWMRVVRYCERSKPNDSAQSVSVLSVR